jgi:hypothetical protein
MLNTLQMRVELRRQGAAENSLVTFSSRPTGRLKIPTFNNTTPYVFGNATLKGVPLVIDVPAASDKAKTSARSPTCGIRPSKTSARAAWTKARAASS